MPRLIATLVLTTVLCPAAFAQGPDAPWRTIETEHFRLHYPAPAEAWAMRAAGRLEAIRARVATEVGYEIPGRVEVVVADPIAQANGMAYPVLGAPRLVLWTSPPPPSSVIGAFADWSELLLLHEQVHLAHLLRPSRSPLGGLLERLLPVGPIALKAPRWVHEGYATMLEGSMTGSGRPHSDLRAAILRRWAQAGRLPSYAQLSSDSRSWMGMSMAYLVGSAYLEWLEQRGGPEAMRHLWRRLTARTGRSFDEAFEGVFGDGPATLYARFRAELTWRALEVERQRSPTHDGELWQDLSWSTGAPDVSPEGERLVIVLRGREKPSRLVILATGPDEEAQTRSRERAERELQRDPLDVAAVRSKPLRRTPIAELVTTNGAEPFSPRFTRDGESVLFVRFEPDPDGFLHPDLFRWRWRAGAVERLTRLADVRDADPAPEGSWAVAVRHRHGLSQLVRVELDGGEVRALTEPSLDELYASPRVSPDGSRLAFVRHARGAWRLIVREVGSGEERELLAAALVADPAWRPDGGAVLASLGRDGFIDVVEAPLDGGEPRPLTAVPGAAVSPAPTPDGAALFFLALEPEGFDLRRLSLAEPGPSFAERPPAALAPAISVQPRAEVVPLAQAEVAPGRPYGVGRQELTPLLSGSTAPSLRSLELGLRSGDVIGRLSALAVASRSEAGPQGGAIAVAWRGWGADLGAHAFAARERPSRQDDATAVLGPSLDVERRALLLGASWERRWRTTELGLGVEALAGEREPVGERARSYQHGALRGALSHAWRRGSRSLWQSAWTRVGAGREAGEEHEFGSLALAAGASSGGSALRVEWRRDRVRDAVSALDRLHVGGVATTLLPEAVVPTRVLEPALPLGMLVGDEHEGQRVEIELGSALAPFFARHRVWDEGGAKGPWLRLAGVSLSLTAGPLPLLRLPGFDFSLGAARVLDPPLEDETQWWLSLAWRP